MDNNRRFINTDNCCYGSLTHSNRITHNETSFVHYSTIPLMKTSKNSLEKTATENINYHHYHYHHYPPSTSYTFSSESSPILLMAGSNNFDNNFANNTTCILDNSSSIYSNRSGSLQEFRPSISRALEYCQNKVLKPYKHLLIVLGWHQPFNLDHNRKFNLIKLLINLLHVIFIIMTICIGHFLQYASCFRHEEYLYGTSSTIYNLNIILENGKKLQPIMINVNETEMNEMPKEYIILLNQNHQYFNLTPLIYDLNLELNKKSINQQPDFGAKNDQTNLELFNGERMHLTHCNGSILTHYFLPSIIHLISYLIILKHLRYCEIDRFHNLCLLNQLLATKIIGYSRTCWKMKRTVKHWILGIVFCLLFIMLQLMFHIFVLNDLTFISFIRPATENLSIILKCTCFFIFTFIELVHISIIIIYALHCQMNIIFIQMNLTAIREKRVDFQVSFL